MLELGVLDLPQPALFPPARQILTTSPNLLLDPRYSVAQKAVAKRDGKIAVIEGVLAPDYPIIARLR